MLPPRSTTAPWPSRPRSLPSSPSSTSSSATPSPASLAGWRSACPGPRPSKANMSPEILLPLLFMAAFVAGLVDSIAGGGGLITVPVLMGIGLPPQVALGTNKLQASFGSGSAMLHFIRSGTVKLSDCISGILWTAAGAAAGVLAIQRLDPAILRHLVPWLLIVIAAYMLFTPKLGSEDIHARISPKIFYPVFGLSIGFYDGFFGPGTGSFWAMAFVLLLGCSLIRATAHTKVMNFTS